MYKLVVILFVIKLYARKNVFKYINKKHKQDMIMLVKSYEPLEIKYMIVESGIKFIKSCKKENLMITFS